MSSPAQMASQAVMMLCFRWHEDRGPSLVLKVTSHVFWSLLGQQLSLKWFASASYRQLLCKPLGSSLPSVIPFVMIIGHFQQYHSSQYSTSD